MTAELSLGPRERERHSLLACCVTCCFSVRCPSPLSRGGVGLLCLGLGVSVEFECMVFVVTVRASSILRAVSQSADTGMSHQRVA